MNTALQELKTLLLLKAFDAYHTPEQGKCVVDALQSLLKVAEISNKCCFFENCIHSEAATGSEHDTPPDNDRVLLLIDQFNQMRTMNNAIFYQSDGDSTETDNSYDITDEGYDVS